MFDRFEEIRTFVALVEAKGFKRAADRMGLVKSAVSRRIRDLEDRLGARLFNRTTRGISLTGAGEAFYERGRKLLADLSEAEDQISAGAQAAVGRLWVSAPVSFTVHCVAPVMHDSVGSRFEKLVQPQSVSWAYLVPPTSCAPSS
jgi:DNA-binding transcriptional LysR family regulator